MLTNKDTTAYNKPKIVPSLNGTQYCICCQGYFPEGRHDTETCLRVFQATIFEREFEQSLFDMQKRNEHKDRLSCLEEWVIEQLAKMKAGL